MKKYRLLGILAAVILTVATVFGVYGCKSEKTDFSFYCPDGAPALALGKYIADEEDFGTGKTFSINVVSSAEINNAILKESADLVILPVNVATKLYKDNGKEDYKMAAVVTHGNFYLMSKTAVSSAEDLIGKVIFVPLSGKVPDLTLQAALKAENIAYEQGDTAKADKVVLNYRYEAAADLVKAMIAGGAEIGLIPEPAATTLKSKGFTEQLNLQTLYSETDKSYPQAVLLVKKSVAKDYPEIISAISSSFASSVKFAEDSPDKAVEAIKGVFDGTSLSASMPVAAVVGCNIYWEGSLTAKNSVNAYLSRIREINPDFAAEVTDEFYL